MHYTLYTVHCKLCTRSLRAFSSTANLRTNIMDFRGFDSNIIIIIRGGIPRPIGNLPECLSRAILVGIMLVGRLGARSKRPRPRDQRERERERDYWGQCVSHTIVAFSKRNGLWVWVSFIVLIGRTLEAPIPKMSGLVRKHDLFSKSFICPPCFRAPWNCRSIEGFDWVSDGTDAVESAAV